MTDRQNVRELARRAKQRMIGGYYGKDAERIRRRTLEDKVLHDKIAAIVERDGTVTDVIAQLLDKDAFAMTDEVGRERMVLRVAAEYRRVREELTRKRAAAEA